MSTHQEKSEHDDANWNLGSDLPVAHPSEDAYGYSAFASQIARAITSTNKPHGLVLAVHGKWGTGKSSLLNFIKHDLKLLPEDKRPVLVDFNPWWFEGREQIANQLLEQFTAQLPDRLKDARKLVKLVGKYSKQIATAAADFSGHSWLKRPIEWAAKYLPSLKWFAEPEGVPQIKKKVATALKSSGKRFVFFVDDIDRLTPDEARDFFRAIKALADFPEVVYLLFFDREEVAKALTTSLGMDGESYLEKIVQAPFHLPAVDKSLLHQKLFKGLDSILESHPLPFDFDQSRWTVIFQDGLDRYIAKPRDIVRIINAISVTYPPLAGEVNPIDFISLEFLRVFEPRVYGSIRDAKEHFCGQASNLDSTKAMQKAYFEQWGKSLPDASRSALISLVGRIFPKVSTLLENDFFASSDETNWVKELRPCSAEFFSVYFQFGIPAGHVTKAELDHLLSRDSPKEISDLLLLARDQVMPDGHSKARDLIDRLREYDDISVESATTLIKALVASGQGLLNSADERGGGFILLNRWRILGLVTKLLERIDINARQLLLRELVQTSPGLWAVVGIVDWIVDSQREPSKAPKAFLDLDPKFPAEITPIVAERLDDASIESLLNLPELAYVVTRWKEWGDSEKIRRKFQSLVSNDDFLLLLLDKFVSTGLRHSGNRTTETYQLYMTPVAAIMDVEKEQHRIKALQSRTNLTVRQKAALDRYLKGLQRMHDGKSPDANYLEDVLD